MPRMPVGPALQQRERLLERIDAGPEIDILHVQNLQSWRLHQSFGIVRRACFEPFLAHHLNAAWARVPAAFRVVQNIDLERSQPQIELVFDWPMRVLERLHAIAFRSAQDLEQGRIDGELVAVVAAEHLDLIYSRRAFGRVDGAGCSGDTDDERMDHYAAMHDADCISRGLQGEGRLGEFFFELHRQLSRAGNHDGKRRSPRDALRVIQNDKLEEIHRLLATETGEEKCFSTPVCICRPSRQLWPQEQTR
jgi:hypothetical protein